MRVTVNINEDKFRLNDVFDGATADDIMANVKTRVARDLPFAVRLYVNSMSPLDLAKELVRRYNAEKKTRLPLPASCRQFLDTAVQMGIATVEEA